MRKAAGLFYKMAELPKETTVVRLFVFGEGSAWKGGHYDRKTANE
jgi:hypothetical protein